MNLPNYAPPNQAAWRSAATPCALLVAALLLLAPSAQAQRTTATPPCDPAASDLDLPDGFCAVIVADTLGKARHMAVAENGDLYVALREVEGGGGIVALRDTTGDGRADVQERFGEVGGTGIGLRGGYLYFAPDTAVLRYALADGELAPTSEPETVVGGFPEQSSHAVKPFTFDDAGHLYVNVGAPSNACQEPSRTPGTPGQDPCPQLELHGGIWRFYADSTGQTQTPDDRYATGIRNAVALDWNAAAGDLYVAQHGRDQLHSLWDSLYTQEESAELPAEELLRVTEGSDSGWPYCYYDPLQEQKVLAPEYGGDGEEVGRCADKNMPAVALPAHWAPNDLLFYTGDQFPERYQNGAFVASHGSWNRAPLPQRGYKIVFVPMGEDGRPTGDHEAFAEGFPRVETIESPNDAEYRPTGLAQGPDGSLYISDDAKGRIWRVLYVGDES